MQTLPGSRYPGNVSLFVRLWVEIVLLKSTEILRGMSASSWGCELKYDCNIFTAWIHGQPLREAVSWNILLVLLGYSCNRQPLREAVSWNIQSISIRGWVYGQPLREAVSWNTIVAFPLADVVSSASSWGCELKCHVLPWTSAGFALVSLFVRLWVEIIILSPPTISCWSASSWGCELKCFTANQIYLSVLVSLFVRLWVEIANIEPFFHRVAVSLFVRLWVEIIANSLTLHSGKSASSWGCELKYFYCSRYNKKYRQPLREAVSWNVQNTHGSIDPVLSASSWGCELKFECNTITTVEECQPLREAVSWNNPSVPTIPNT